MVWWAASSDGKTARRWSAVFSTVTSAPSPPDSVNPTTSCDPRHCSARSRLASVMMSGASAATAAASGSSDPRSAAYTIASSPAISPAAAASITPSPLPASTTVRVSARTTRSGWSTATNSTGATGAPMRPSPSSSSSTIATSGVFTAGVPYGTGAPSPAGRWANRSLITSGRGVRNRSKARSFGTQMVSTASRRATRAIESGSMVPAWNRLSSAYSRSIAPGLPRGRSSRVTSGLSVSPGRGGSTVYPQRNAPNSEPGTWSTRVSLDPASSAAAASDQAAGTSWSRSRAGSTSPPFHSAGTLTTASSPIAHAAHGCQRRRRPPIAATSAPAPSARPNELSGTARVLLRSASPRPVSASGDINGDGSSMGWTPTASTTPATTSNAA